MNRRSFLSGLIALPVAAHLGRVNRVYSFPTNIVIAKPVQTYVFGKDAIYCANLPQSAAIYFDYLNYYDVAWITAVDPVAEKVAREMAQEMGYRAALLL